MVKKTLSQAPKGRFPAPGAGRPFGSGQPDGLHLVRWRRLKDRLAGRLFWLMALLPVLILLLMGAGLAFRTRPLLVHASPWDLLLGRIWSPLQGLFGYLPFIAGTLWVTAVAMIIALPPSLLMAVYLAEYAHPRTRNFMKPTLDLLAAIPSVVYGVWGLVAVVPLVQGTLAPFFSRGLGFLPIFRSQNPTGYSILAGGIVLAVMVAPVISAITCEVLEAVPHGLREASLALGSTRWQAIKHVVLRKAGPGVTAAVVLGFSRAFGETMAVLMVVGNVARIPNSIFDPAYPLTALIANNYGEMLSIPLYDAALLGAALILLLVVLCFNMGAALILRRVQARES
jgi:phosphate transport system permease protein